MIRRRLHDLMLWLSTADRTVLELCPVEESRFIAAGGAVLTTSAMALLSGTFLFHKLVHLAVLPATVLGVGFALAIMNLERYVQASIRRQRTVGLTLLSAVPRIALAFLMGLVMAVPLTLCVFKREVELQAIENRNHDLRVARQALGKQFGDIPRLQSEQTRLQANLHTLRPGTVLKTSPEYRALGRRLSQLQIWVRTTRDPKLVRSYHRQINILGPQIQKLRGELLAQESDENVIAREEQRARLRELDRQLEPMLREKADKDVELAARFAGAPGLADHVKALDMLKDSNTAVRQIDRLLWIFILTIDALPAVLKTLMSVGRMSLYERLQNASEAATARAGEEAERLRCEAAIQDTAAFHERQREIVDARLDDQMALQREIDMVFMGVVAERLQPRAKEWARTTADRYADAMEQEADGDRGDDPSADGPPAPDAAPFAKWRGGLARALAKWAPPRATHDHGIK